MRARFPGNRSKPTSSQILDDHPIDINGGRVDVAYFDYAKAFDKVKFGDICHFSKKMSKTLFFFQGSLKSLKLSKIEL